jgi:integrase
MAKHKGLYKRGNVWWLAFVGLDGRLQRVSSGLTNFKEAQVKLEDARAEVRKGNEPEGVKKMPNLTFSELAERYRTWCKAQRGYEVSKKYYVDALESRFGHIHLNRISTIIVEEYVNELLAEKKSAAHVNRIIGTLKNAIRKAVDFELCSEATLKQVRKIKTMKENKLCRFLSHEEAATLIENCPERIRHIVVFALNTGCRRGEILGLKWSSVDLKHGFLRLEETKSGEKRDIPVNDTLRGVLEGLSRRLDCDYVFQMDGQRMGEFKRSFKTALTKSGISNFRFHDLRHCFASWLAMKGVPLLTISRLLGHSDVKMTMRYAHLAPNYLHDAVNMLNIGQENPTSHLLHNQAVNQ